jgi:tetratricopeptide (TPR) repeat protein
MFGPGGEGNFATRSQCEAYRSSSPAFERNNSYCAGFDASAPGPQSRPPSTGLNRAAQAARLNQEGILLFKKGDLVGARQKFLDALGLTEGRNTTYKVNAGYLIALVLLEEGHYDLAVRQLQEVVQWDPSHRGARDALALARAKLKGLQDSSKLNAEGNTLFERGDFAGAAKKYRQALALAPSNNIRANLALAEGADLLQDANNGRGEYASATPKLREAVALNPSARNLLSWLLRSLNGEALALSQRGDYAGAVAKYREALGYLRPDEPLADQADGWGAVTQSNLADAERVLAKVRAAIAELDNLIAELRRQ